MIDIRKFRKLCDFQQIYPGQCFGYYSNLNNPKGIVFNGKFWEDALFDKEHFLWLPSHQHTIKIDVLKGWEQFDLYLIAYNHFTKLSIENNNLEISLLYKYPFVIDDIFIVEYGISVAWE